MDRSVWPFRARAHRSPLVSAGVSPVPDEAVEAAARAMYESVLDRMRFPTGWDDAPEPLRQSYRDMATAALPSLREGIAAETLAPVLAALDRLDAAHARSDEAKWGAGRAVAVIRAAMFDTVLSPMRIEARGSCGVSRELGSQWRNGEHWHTVWPEGGHWCFESEADAAERAIEVRDIWREHPHLAPVQAAEGVGGDEGI